MDDQRLENILSHLLRAGVLLAAAVVFAGGVLYLVQHHSDKVNYRTFNAGSKKLETLSGIAELAGGLNAEGLMQLGLVLLIATPVARVAMAVVGFRLERDYMYVVVSLIVFGVLLYSLMHAT